MTRAWLIAVAALLGCSSADFDVAQGNDAAATDTDVPSGDTSDPRIDTGSGVDSSITSDTTGPEVCPPNACGGCGVLAKEPGTPCGLCMTSKFVCSTTVLTKCELLDDRTEFKDDYSNAFDGNGLTLGSPQSVAIAFNLLSAGSPTKLTLAMQRYDVNPGSTVGNLQVRLIKGTPSLTVDSSAVLAVSNVSATTIPDTPTYVVVVLPAGIGPLAMGTPLWIEVTDHSDLSNFAVNGANGPKADLRFYFSATSGYTEKVGLDPYLVVGMNGCR